MFPLPNHSRLTLRACPLLLFLSSTRRSPSLCLVSFGRLPLTDSSTIPLCVIIYRRSAVSPSYPFRLFSFAESCELTVFTSFPSQTSLQPHSYTPSLDL